MCRSARVLRRSSSRAVSSPTDSWETTRARSSSCRGIACAAPHQARSASEGTLVGLVWRAPSIILPDGGVLRVGEGACRSVAQACEVVLVAAKSLRRGLHLEGAKALIDHLQGSEKGGGVVSTALVGFGGQCRAKHLPDDVVMLHGSPPPSAPSLRRGRRSEGLDGQGEKRMVHDASTRQRGTTTCDTNSGTEGQGGTSRGTSTRV